MWAHISVRSRYAEPAMPASDWFYVVRVHSTTEHGILGDE